MWMDCNNFKKRCKLFCWSFSFILTYTYNTIKYFFLKNLDITVIKLIVRISLCIFQNIRTKKYKNQKDVYLFYFQITKHVYYILSDLHGIQLLNNKFYIWKNYIHTNSLIWSDRNFWTKTLRKLLTIMSHV